MRRPAPLPRLALLLALSAMAPPLAGLPTGARAQGIDLSGGGPVDITATDGIEWRQAEQVVVARGNAKAVRGTVTVEADRLIARYRPQGNSQAAPSPRTRTGAGAAAEPALGGSSEIWRLEAEGRVTISTPTDTARGDRAVYDIDQAVLVLTGRNLSLATRQQVITARDSLEYWSQRKMAVARGNALVVDNQEGRRIGADTLVAYFLEGPDAGPQPSPAAGQAGQDLPGAGRLDRVEAFGNVEIRTATEVVRGDRGVYSPASGMARLLGDVRITRGDNQINGREAIVNLRTGVARLVSSPGARVQGLVVPQGAREQASPQGTREQAAPQQQQPAERRRP